jgi:hypothetical protein
VKITVGIVSLTFVIIAFAAAPKSPTPTKAQIAYTGDGPCLRCHHEYASVWRHDAKLKNHSEKIVATFTALKPEIAQPLARQLNDVLLKTMPTAPERKVAVNVPPQLGCETCHGPGSFHNAGLRDDVIRWRRLQYSTDGRDERRIARQTQDAICLPCHVEKFKQDKEDWTLGPHKQSGPGCTSCHEVHHPERIRSSKWLIRESSVEANCLRSGCHDDVLKKSLTNRHHPLQEKDGSPIDHWGTENTQTKTQCTVCHVVHGNRNHDYWQLSNQPDKPNRKYLKLSAASQKEEDFVKMCDHCHTGQKDKPRNIGFDKKDHQNTEKAEFAKSHQKMPTTQEAGCVLCHGAKSCTSACHRANSSRTFNKVEGIYMHKRLQSGTGRSEVPSLRRHSALLRG